MWPRQAAHLLGAEVAVPHCIRTASRSTSLYLPLYPWTASRMSRRAGRRLERASHRGVSGQAAGRLASWGMAFVKAVSRITEPRQICAVRLQNAATPAALPAAGSRGRLATLSPAAPFSGKAAHARRAATLAAVAPGVDPSVLLDAPTQLWDYYQAILETNPIATKAVISGCVYLVGDLIAQSYEGLTEGAVDKARAVRSGLCGLLAHGPLSHFWYLFCDGAIAELPVSSHAWYVPGIKILFDQTVWSATWNGTYYGLLGVLRREPPAVIAASVRASCVDLMVAGWKLWPLAHLVTYGLMPIEHRLLWVDSVELIWVMILSTYGQQQRQAIAGAEPAALHVEAALAEQLVAQEMLVAAVPALPAVE